LASLDTSGTNTSQAHPSARGRCRRGNAGVAAGGHDHAAGRNRVGQQAVEHAARLEAAADLQVLQLQPDLGAADAQRTPGSFHSGV
jgi:hypothetical protein